MEGSLGILAAGLALVALIVAGSALWLVLRPGREPAAWPSAGHRAAELERRVVQLGQRLEVLEADVDTQRSTEGRERSGPTTVRTAGVALSHVGLVRFDAFEDAGGAQSFALALLDDDGDGVVLTSLHSRQATRLYIKGVRRGVADAPLSGEEVRAMQHAGIPPTV